MTSTQEIQTADVIQWWTNHGRQVPSPGTSEWDDMVLTYQRWHQFRNVLVQYKGGGYDGCYWEYNYAYFDTSGEFHCIIATGSNGCETEVDLREFWDRCPDKFSSIDLNKESWETFQSEEATTHVLRLAKWFWFERQIDLSITCTECGAVTPGAKMFGDNPRGCGGVAMTYDDLLCPKCAERRELEEEQDD